MLGKRLLQVSWGTLLQAVLRGFLTLECQSVESHCLAVYQFLSRPVELLLLCSEYSMMHFVLVKKGRLRQCNISLSQRCEKRAQGLDFHLGKKQ